MKRYSLFSMGYLKHLSDAIGNIPLVELHSIDKKIKPKILVKPEYLNPGGSVKDRIAVYMVNKAEEEGLIKPGGTVIEATSGNTGAALALVCAERGYNMIFTMTEKISKEKELFLRAFGAEVIRCPTDATIKDPEYYENVATKRYKEMHDNGENVWMPNQYENKYNPEAHEKSTGPEIWKAIGNRLTHFVAGIGTGGTICGVANYLKSQGPTIQIVGADPIGSIYTRFLKEGKIDNNDIDSYLVEGIGMEHLPGSFDKTNIDDVVQMGDQECADNMDLLLLQEGIPVGPSSGAALYAALETAKNLRENDLVVVLLPDGIRNYLETWANKDWRKENGLK